MSHCRTVQGRESLIFQTHVTFSIDFPNTYKDYYLADVIDSFNFSCYFHESDFSPPPSPGAYAFLTSSVHVPLDSVFNQI